MSSLDERMYLAYASTHAGRSERGQADLSYRRDIRPHLPATISGARVLDIGAGQGDLIRLLVDDGFAAQGVDISPEQVDLARAAGLTQVELNDFHRVLDTADGSWDAVIATDLLEHLEKAEVLRTFDEVRYALRPGGVFIARAPNAVSPMGGNYMYGDITHQTWLTRRSVHQLAAVAGFDRVDVYACPPIVHGPTSALRAAIWKPISGLLKLALAAETGQLTGHIITQNLVFVAHQAGSSKGTTP
jgi:2-polyprenyl-3-methyl-5-hydroxy-6-metoxy-1,4-benzoquinol methylase